MKDEKPITKESCESEGKDFVAATKRKPYCRKHRKRVSEAMAEVTRMRTVKLAEPVQVQVAQAEKAPVICASAVLEKEIDRFIKDRNPKRLQSIGKLMQSIAIDEKKRNMLINAIGFLFADYEEFDQEMAKLESTIESADLSLAGKRIAEFPVLMKKKKIEALKPI